MKIGIAATGGSLEAQVAEQFGRCPYFIVVDTEASGFEAFTNPASGMGSGAGPAAVQALTQKGVQMVLAGKLGPNAEEALRQAGIGHTQASGKVRDAVAQFGQANQRDA